MSIRTRSLLGLCCFCLLFGCSRNLDINNPNNPDETKVYLTLDDVDATLSRIFLDYWHGTQYYTPSLSLAVLADELTSQWKNFGMRFLVIEPRTAWNNTTETDQDLQDVTLHPWTCLYRALNNAGDMCRILEHGGLREDGEPLDDIQVRPRKAYIRFVQGLSLGWLACLFDRAYVIDENSDIRKRLPPLDSYSGVMAAALEKFEDCIELCEEGPFDSSLPDLSAWINGNPLDCEGLASMAHAAAARLQASVNRSPAERNSANWTDILSHIENAVKEDRFIECDGEQWWSGYHYLGCSKNWAFADYRTLGPADTSGNYEIWLASPFTINYSPRPFQVFTADRRICGPEIITDGIDFGLGYVPPVNCCGGLFSYYYCKRYSKDLGAVQDPIPLFLKTEMDLLKAEGLLRLGDAAGAAELIDRTRVGRGSLPPADGSQIGNPEDPRRIQGSLWSMLKYEKGIECFMAASGLAYFDRRGWGELTTGTPIHFPIPARELELLLLDNYTFGGGGAGSAPKISVRPRNEP